MHPNACMCTQVCVCAPCRGVCAPNGGVHVLHADVVHVRSSACVPEYRSVCAPNNTHGAPRRGGGYVHTAKGGQSARRLVRPSAGEYVRVHVHPAVVVHVHSSTCAPGCDGACALVAKAPECWDTCAPNCTYMCVSFGHECTPRGLGTLCGNPDTGPKTRVPGSQGGGERCPCLHSRGDFKNHGL